MDKLAKPKNRALFLVSVAVTGAFAGAAVWLFFFAMEHGIDYLWTEIPHMLGAASPELASGPFGFLPYPFFVCLLGGLLIGLYEKLTGTIKLPKAQKTVVYGIAIAGGLGTYLLLGQLMGGGMGMPRFEAAEVGNLELAWLIPLSLIGTVCGWLYFVSEHASEALAHAIGERPVVKAMLAGLALAICGTVLPYTMFAGETQADVLMETYLTIPAGVLIATGLVKAMLTPALINMGWRGGHFFPVIFSGVSLGYGLAILTGADPVFCVAVRTASTMGAVMRQPVMVVGLLLMCFPLKGIVCMIIAAVIAAGIPLPKSLRK